MRRFVLVLLALAGLGLASAASAGGWSVGWSDYGRHGGYSISYGRYGGHSYTSFGVHAPAWSYGGYGYRDPWFVGGYRRPSYAYYDSCYYGCGGYYGYRDYGYRAPAYYGYRYSAPSYRYHDRGYRHDRRYGRYDSYSRYDRHDYDRGYRHARYDRDDRYDRRDRYQRRSESAWERTREHTYDAHDDAWRGQRGREAW